MKKHLLIYILLFISAALWANSPKREMRAAWLATVFRIDWPRTVITSTGNQSQIDAQKREMTQILDALVSANMNAVYFQIRSRTDAMYKSSYEPWSTDLVSTRGMDPGYDPLQFVVEEGHKRGLEVHAWLNPYRFETVENQWSGLPGDYKSSNPDWVLTYPTGYTILDPGQPEVVEQITNIVGEVVTNYDVDGIIFDDYFYAYGGTPAALDIASQNKYKPSDLSVGDWRRANIAKMIASVYNRIQDIKPYVTFGVSPFGIWTTNSQVASKEEIELPAGITGGNMYEEIYCDPVPWMRSQTVDYISPQLYWPTNAISQSYNTLSPWWSDLANRFGVHMYASQNFSEKSESTRSTIVIDNENTISANTLSGIEKASLEYTRTTRALNPIEFGLQIDVNRSADKNGGPGTIFYPANRITGSKTYIDNLTNNHFKYRAITPAINWKNHQEWETVTNLSIEGNQLKWNSAGNNLRYTIYAIPNSEVASLKGSMEQYLLDISYTNSYTIPAKTPSTDYVYAVAILDRYSNEYPLAFSNGLQRDNETPQLLLPIADKSVIHPLQFEWEPIPNIEQYQFELAEDEGFNKIIYSREVATNNIKSTQTNMLKERSYYWRVKSRVSGALDRVSDVRKIDLNYFSVLSPNNEQTEVSVTPTIQWTNIASDETGATLELSTTPSFLSNNIVYSQSNLKENSLTIPEETLSYNSTYYARTTALIDNKKYETPTIKFETTKAVPPVPVIITPENNSTSSGTTLDVTWADNPFASSFRIELSKKNTFPLLGLNILNPEAYIYTGSFKNLSAGTYYIRAHALYGLMKTNWSDIVKVEILPTSINETTANTSNCYVTRNNKQAELVISLNEPSFVSATLYSISGTKIIDIVSNQFMQDGETTIPVAIDLTKGIYIIKVNMGNTIKTIKHIN